MPLIDAISAAALAKIDDYNQQNIANTAWAFAKLVVTHQPLLASISAAAITRSSEFIPQGLANLAWALAKLVVLDAPLMPALSSAAMPNIDEYVPQNLSNMSWAFATLGVLHQPDDCYIGCFPCQARLVSSSGHVKHCVGFRETSSSRPPFVGFYSCGGHSQND